MSHTSPQRCCDPEIRARQKLLPLSLELCTIPKNIAKRGERWWTAAATATLLFDSS
jgi:hypothetical protein